MNLLLCVFLSIQLVISEKLCSYTTWTTRQMSKQVAVEVKIGICKFPNGSQYECYSPPPHPAGRVTGIKILNETRPTIISTSTLYYKCCPGYKDYGSGCTPICSTPCSNSYCSTPEICTCNKGYDIDPNNKYNCIPSCSHFCENGVCSESQVCSCSTGYVKDLSTWYKCNPICSQTCRNGFCSAPESCTCNPGYKLDVNNKYVCNPVCSAPCQNEGCSTSNNCSCNPEYSLESNNKYQKCDPVCLTPCNNGTCSEENECVCNVGYEKINGSCYLACADGQTLNEDRLICESICLNKCINGNCTESDCVCFENWTGSNCNTSITSVDIFKRYKGEIYGSFVTCLVLLFAVIIFVYKMKFFGKNRKFSLDNTGGKPCEDRF